MKRESHNCSFDFSLQVLKIFIPISMYYALFAQIDSSWTFQSSQLNTAVFGIKIQADQAKAMGALLLLIQIPLWQNIIVPILLAFDIRISPLKSILMGGVSAILAYLCAAILQLNIEQRLLSNSIDQLSILWQFPQFFFIMLGELWLSIPGLSFSFTQSPPSMRSVMTSFWFLQNAFGNLIVIAITEMHLFKLQSNEYFFYATLMFFAMLLFNLLAKNYRYMNYDNSLPDSHGQGLKRRSSSLPCSTIASQEALNVIF